MDKSEVYCINRFMFAGKGNRERSIPTHLVHIKMLQRSLVRQVSYEKKNES